MSPDMQIVNKKTHSNQWNFSHFWLLFSWLIHGFILSPIVVQWRMVLLSVKLGQMHAEEHPIFRHTVRHKIYFFQKSFYQTIPFVHDFVQFFNVLMILNRI